MLACRRSWIGVAASRSIRSRPTSSDRVANVLGRAETLMIGIEGGLNWRIGVAFDDGQTFYVYLGLR